MNRRNFFASLCEYFAISALKYLTAKGAEVRRAFFATCFLTITIAAHAQPNITAAEYFFNTDPGPGNGTPITVTAGTTIDINNLNIPTTSLSLGWHLVCVRVKDANNVWGFYECRRIYIRETPPVIPTDVVYPVSQMEYFYNTDNGPGTGTPISITQGDNIDVVNTDLTNTLPLGWHTIHVRTKNTNNVWGFYESRKIYVREPVVIPPIPPVEPVTAMEFFYNTDNGPGTGTVIPITSGHNIDLVNTNLANTLPLGWHTVHVRTKNNANVWGFYESRKIYVREPPTPCCAPPAPIVELEYFVDADPGVGLSTTKVTINPSSANIDLVDEPLDVGTQSLGAHKIYVRAKNQDGQWSMSETANFSVIASCPILTAPSATGVARCDAGPVTLTASGASAGETYRWYATSSSLTPLFTGNPYTTASLNANTTFYVTAYNPTTYCESARTPVTAEISGIAKPVLSISGSLAVCEGITQVVTAPSGFSTYIWSNGLTTQQITVTTSGSYSVVVNNGVCSSPPSDPFVFTVNSKPAKPTIAATGGGSLCGASSVTLSAPVGLSSYTWSTGETTQSITVSSIGNYLVTVTNAADCQSVPSDPFIVTSSSISKPIISVTGSTVICDGGNTVTLDAPLGFSTYSWSNGATTQQIIVSAAGNYTVTVANGSCTSPASDAVTVTAISSPSKPVIQVSGNLALCNGAFVALSAPTGFSNYVWSNGETTRQIVVSTAGNFSVQVGDATSCLSQVSDAVTVTSTGANCIVSTASPTVTSASRCGQGTVNLTASGASGAQEYRWYDLLAGGTLLFTGSLFTTPDLTTTTSYYVSIFDPTTGESNRVMATATVVNLAKPVTDVTGSISICAGSSTLISAPVGFVQYKWSDGSDKQQLQVTTAGNYSVQTGDGTCLSVSSDVVTVSVEAPPAKPIITTTGNATLCGGSVTLTGPAAFSGYLWSTGETTQAITVTQVGSYTLTVSNASGCGSTTSDPFIVTGSIAKPVVSMVGSDKFCEGQSSTLVGPVGFSSYKWSSGETTQQLTVTTAGSYSLQVTNTDGCTSVASDAIVITVDPKPAKPTITTSGSTTFCAGQNVKLKGPDGFSYIWSTGETNQEITVSEAGSYSLLVRNANNCISAVSDPVLVTVNICSTNPPVIEDKVIRTSVESRITESLIEYFSDKDNDVDLTTIEIITPPASGALAMIDANHNLVLDYSGLLFAGDETITVQICDLAKNCTTGNLVIRVSGDVVVYNAISPNGDGLNESLYLEYINLLDETKNNRVRIFNRWGDTVYDAKNYNNTTIVFNGVGSNGEALPPGTYFYRMDFDSGIPYKTGYFSLRR